jgi:ribonuclease HI
MSVNIVHAADLYTDGSCDTESLTGAWVCILLSGEERKQLSGVETGTTHNRMELLAVINGLEYVRDHHPAISRICIYSDSQYVTGLESRRKRLSMQDFTTKKGKALPNADLVMRLFKLYDLYTVETIKIKAHQKKNELNAGNIEADLLSRKLVREAVKARFTLPHLSLLFYFLFFHF